MSDPARQAFLVTRDAFDTRADQHNRTIHMSMTQVSIERVVQGIKMRIGVPIATYRALRIRVQAPRGVATLTLSHADSELDVVLASGEATEVTIAARAWAAVLEKTIVVEAGATMLPAIPRRAAPPIATRDASLARRRGAGDPARMATRFGGEREIIARS
jgi:hypothetical protein